MVPSHYLNQRCNILSIGPLQTNFSENLIEFIYLQSRKCIWRCRLEKGVHFALAILSGPQWVNMNQVYMLVYSRSVTMPGLGQNWSLHQALGRYRHKVVLANYGVKKTTREHVLGRRWVDIGRAMSVQRRFEVGLMSPADVGRTSVQRQSQYLNIIIKTNRNVPQRNATIHFCPQRNQITTTDRSMMHASLWYRCKQILTAKSRSVMHTQRSADLLRKWSKNRALNPWINENVYNAYSIHINTDTAD